MCAKLFRNGRSQAMRLPAEFRVEGTEVEVHSDAKSGAVVLLPVRPPARAWRERRDALLRVPGLRAEIDGLWQSLRATRPPKPVEWPQCGDCEVVWLF